jgi:PPOX class probable F420-dependent enzyme
MIEIPDSHKDLLHTGVGILATIGRKGFPQVTALWFLYDEVDGLVKISLNTTRQKLKNLQANPKCTFFILDTANTGRWLEIRARAEITPDPDYAFADQVSPKYGGLDFRKIDPPGESRVKVTLHPVKVNVRSPRS